MILSTRCPRPPRLRLPARNAALRSAAIALGYMVLLLDALLWLAIAVFGWDPVGSNEIEPVGLDRSSDCGLVS